MKRRIMAFVSVLSLLAVPFCLSPLSAAAASTERVYVTMETADSYADYIAAYADAAYPQTSLTIEGATFSSSDYSPSVLTDYAGNSGDSVRSDETGYVEWSVPVTQAGFYQMMVEYYPIEGRSASISRQIWIDGKLPFEEARNVLFDRVWADVVTQDGQTITKDANDNDIRPEQTEKPMWRQVYVKDALGYTQQPLYFYFGEGTHTLRFVAEREPMLIRRIVLCQSDTPAAYATVAALYEKNGYTAGSGEPVKYQAEYPYTKSDSMIVPEFDRSTASVEPCDAAKLRLNVIGADSMQQNGQWLNWQFTVPSTGLYTISLKAVQNTLNGAVSARRITVDGKVPFAELENVYFPYSSRWQMVTLGDGEDAYSFYLEEGVTHELGMEVVLGESAKAIRSVSLIVDELNRIYRQILVVTGPTPDTNRDYQFQKTMPDMLTALSEQGKQLEAAYDELNTMAGQSGETTQILIRTARQIRLMCDDPDSIAERFSMFQSNISSLATWLTTAQTQPLTLDYFVVAPAGTTDLPKATVSFWKEIKFQVGSFLSSFTEDYNTMANEGGAQGVSVWVGSGLTGGRDQAQIIKNMISNYFTPLTGINANVSLVSMGALLPATLADKGPDVALSIDAASVANYAFRNALEDLTKFADCAEVTKAFNKNSLTPISFQGGLYGLPETMTYPMMFYRKDILQELGVDIPQTWDDVIRILPILQKKQLNFGLPTTTGNTGSTLSAFNMLLYQHGGALYTEDGSHSTIDSEQGLEAFSFLTSLYSDYELSQTLSFENRFRTGEVPIGIADYSSYNQLSVFAPELAGVWDFTSVPGIMQEDGTIKRSVAATVTACILMSKSKNQENAWNFMKWWTGTDAQVKFGRELESVMGTAARYPTANQEAMYQIPWSLSNFERLAAQDKWVIGVPEVPGGYYTARYIDFAFRDVMYQAMDPGEALAAAVESIDFELATKRREFGLPVS